MSPLCATLRQRRPSISISSSHQPQPKSPRGAQHQVGMRRVQDLAVDQRQPPAGQVARAGGQVVGAECHAGMQGRRGRSVRIQHAAYAVRGVDRSRLAQFQRLPEHCAQLVVQRIAADAFRDPGQHGVAGVAVAAGLSWRVHQGRGGDQPDQILGRDVPPHQFRPIGGQGGVVAQARAVPQQMHGRDARIQAAIRQVSGGAVVQIELAMLREQQDRGGRVALAQGSDAKAGVRGVLAAAG